MLEHDQDTLEMIREQVTDFLAIVSQLIVSPGKEAEIEEKVTELKQELAKDNPDIEAVRDMVESVKGIIDGMAPIKLH